MNRIFSILFEAGAGDGGGGTTAPTAPPEGGAPTTPPPGAAPTAPTAPVDWRSALPDDIRSEKSLDAFTGKTWDEVGPTMAQQFVHSQKKLGERPLSIPSKEASQEEKEAFHEKLGWPKEAKNYKLETETPPQGYELKEETGEKARAIFHKHHLTAEQAAGVYKDFTNMLFEEHTAFQTESSAATKLADDTMKTEWGQNYDAEKNKAIDFIKRTGSPELEKFLFESNLGNNPAMIKWANKLANSVGEDFLKAAGGGGAVPTGPTSIQELTAKYNADPEKRKALRESWNPRHAEVQKEWDADLAKLNKLQQEKLRLQQQT